ncbi:MAG: hypothetical protein PVJ71_07670 [Lysobacterales bacterium]
MRRLFFLFLFTLPLSVNAESTLPLMKDLAGDAELPRPWGIGLDFYTMDQDYDIEALDFALPIPGVSLGDPSDIMSTNEVMHFDLKADVWLLPFLNVFAIVGRVDTDTTVDFSQAEITGLPFDLGTLLVNFDGTVFGGGFTLAYGTEDWFASATTTLTETSISGDFKSSVDSFTVQPRLGLVRGNWTTWVGAMYLDVDESHRGAIDLPFIGPVDFAVDLATTDHWNYAIGVAHHFGDRANLSFEVGFGNREHTLFNFNYRF